MAHKAREAETSAYVRKYEPPEPKSESRQKSTFWRDQYLAVRGRRFYPDHALCLRQALVSLFSYLRFVWIALSRKVLVREDLKLATHFTVGLPLLVRFVGTIVHSFQQQNARSSKYKWFSPIQTAAPH